jgi:hypothetical protein
MSTSEVTDEEHAQLDKGLPRYLCYIPVETLDDIETSATVLAAVIKAARTIFSAHDQPLDDVYFENDALLEENKELLNLLKSAHKDKKYADVRFATDRNF